MTARNDKADTDGFTLVEVLCAFVILSLSSVVMLQTIETVAKNISSSVERSKINALTAKIELMLSASGSEENFPSEGYSDGFNWTLQPLEFSDPARGKKSGPAILRIYRNNQEKSYSFIIMISGK